jgi:hypothetical protein
MGEGPDTRKGHGGGGAGGSKTKTQGMKRQDPGPVIQIY